MIITDKSPQEQWTCDEQHALDKWEAIEWARRICDRSDVIYLDTETTGLNDPYPVEIAILSRHGSPLLNTLVKPPVPVEPGAEAVHGITPQMLEDAPTFADIYLQLAEILYQKQVIIYNMAFDCKVLENACKFYDLPQLNYRTACAMRYYAQYFGDWNDYYGNYKWQKLPNAGHRAKDDAFACRELVRRMAIAPYCEVEYSRMFPPVQLFCEWKEFAKLELSWRDKNGWYSIKSFRALKFYLPKFWWKHNQSTIYSTKVEQYSDIDKEVDDIPW